LVGKLQNSKAYACAIRTWGGVSGTVGNCHECYMYSCMNSATYDCGTVNLVNTVLEAESSYICTPCKKDGWEGCSVHLHHRTATDGNPCN